MIDLMILPMMYVIAACLLAVGLGGAILVLLWLTSLMRYAIMIPSTERGDI